MSSSIAEHVARGAQFLDEQDPGWWREDVERAIDLDALDLNHTGMCVLGQRCPLEVLNSYAARAGCYSANEGDRYYAYVIELSSMDGADCDRWAHNHGFSLFGIDCHPRGWNELTDAWHDLIVKRRKDAANESRSPVGGAS